VKTHRLEAFADGVFAIAATLLIIDVSVDARGGELGAALQHSWPQYAAYAVSFVTIGIMWVNHHACLEQIDRGNRTFSMLNIGLLTCIAFVPFPTRLVAEHLRDDGVRVAAIAYGMTMTITALFFAAFWFYAAIGRRLIATTADQQVVSGISRAFLPGAPIYGASTLVAVWAPHVSIILFALIAAFYLLESSVFARGLTSR
jgi:uncharacterized membrane protein